MEARAHSVPFRFSLLSSSHRTNVFLLELSRDISLYPLGTKSEADQTQSLNGGLQRCSCLCERRHYPCACLCGSLTKARCTFKDKLSLTVAGMRFVTVLRKKHYVRTPPTSPQRFFFNNRCPMVIKRIGHMLLFTMSLSLPLQQMKVYRCLS